MRKNPSVQPLIQPPPTPIHDATATDKEHGTFVAPRRWRKSKDSGHTAQQQTSKDGIRKESNASLIYKRRHKPSGSSAPSSSKNPNPPTWQFHPRARATSWKDISRRKLEDKCKLYFVEPVIKRM